MHRPGAYIPLDTHRAMGSVGAPGGIQRNPHLKNAVRRPTSLRTRQRSSPLGTTLATGWHLMFRQRKKNPERRADQGSFSPGRPVRVAFQVNCGSSTHCRLAVLDGSAGNPAKPNRIERQCPAAAPGGARKAFDQRGTRFRSDHRVSLCNEIFKTVGAAFYGCLDACQRFFPRIENRGGLC